MNVSATEANLLITGGCGFIASIFVKPEVTLEEDREHFLGMTNQARYRNKEKPRRSNLQNHIREPQRCFARVSLCLRAGKLALTDGVTGST